MTYIVKPKNHHPLLEKNELEMYRKARGEIDELFSNMTEIRKSYVPTLLEASKKSDN